MNPEQRAWIVRHAELRHIYDRGDDDTPEMQAVVQEMAAIETAVKPIPGPDPLPDTAWLIRRPCC